MGKMRLAVTKNVATQYVGHLDFGRSLERALRRAKLPVALSEGFNPHMKISFGPALGVGVASRAEYVDVELSAPVDVSEFGARLTAQLPPGLTFVAARSIQSSASLAAALNVADYQAEVGIEPEPAVLLRARSAAAAFLTAEKVIYVRHTPKGEKSLELKQYLMGQLTIEAGAGVVKIGFRLRMTTAGAVKPQELLATLVSQFDFPAGPVACTRTGLWHDTGAEMKTAFDI